MMASRLRCEGKVSVVLGTFNRANYIDEALTSLLEQTRPVDEIVVVDDGSTDQTAERVAKYSAPVRYFRKENGGRASALNYGLECAMGGWIWFFDDDDVALPDALERMLAALSSDPSADFAYSSQIIGREGPQRKLIRESVVALPKVPPEALFHHALKEYPFRTQGMLIRRRCFDEVGAFDARYLRGQDYEFYTRFLRRFRGVPVEGPTFIFRAHDGPRGPKAQRHHGAARSEVWMHYNSKMGRELRQRLPLGEYLFPPHHGEEMTPALEHRALVQRMAVMATKGLIAEMLDDLRAAATMRPLIEQALGPGEALACFQAVTNEDFLRKFTESPPEIAAALIAAGGASGRDILSYIARGLIWAGRTADLTVPDRIVLIARGLQLLFASGRWPRRVW